MITKIKSSAIIFLAVLIGFNSCKKEKFSFGDIKTPSGLTLTTVVTGTDASNPNGDGTGFVVVTATSGNALSYNIDFGDGKGFQVVSSGSINYKYSSPGSNDYTITVNAIGTGGATSTISKKIKVFVAFVIPAPIIDALTGGSSKVWITDKDATGHFGVGPNNQFAPIWYAATPNSREPCAYDDEITFSKDALNRISMNVDNKDSHFLLALHQHFMD